LVPLTSSSSVVGGEIPSIAPTTDPKRKKGKIECDVSQVFKDEWATKFPWVELIINLKGKLQMVHCKVCTQMEGKEKLLYPKLNGLQKHSSRWKSLILVLELQWEIIIRVIKANTRKMKGFVPFSL
jgi:hypothetical protein